MTQLIFLDCGTETRSWSAFQTHSYFLGIQPPTDYQVYHCRLGKLPSQEEIDACQVICIPGSNFFIKDQYEWLKGVYSVLDEACRQDKFIIGFCYGHQLICKYLGAKIGTLPDSNIGTRGLVLNSLGKELVGHEYILAFVYYVNYVEDIKDTRLISLCRFNNDICIAYNRQGNINIITSQVHPEFSFRLQPDHQNILDILGKEPYITYNSTIRKDYEECLSEEGCSSDNPYISVDSFRKHYLYDRDDPNKLYYMYQSSKWLRTFYLWVLSQS